MSKNVIYLDNNATTRVDPLVLETILPYFSEYYGNPSSMHAFGGQVSKAVSQARQNIADLIGANNTEIVFTSGGTEGNNAAIRAALKAQGNRKQIITTQVEHPAVLNTCKHFEKQGYDVTYLSVDGKGQIDLAEFEEALSEETALVSMMYANNETGTIFPVEEVAQRAKQVGAIVHIDAVQAVGKVSIDLSQSSIDLLTLSGHKLHAPKGIGVLYVRRGTRFRPLLIGGHQERGRRGGTENVPGIIGLGKAAELAKAHIEKEQTQVRALRDRLERGLLEAIPDCQVNGDPVQRLPNTSNIGFKYIEGEAILFWLNQYGICASSGSACTSGSLEPSHVLQAMGLPYTILHGSIRFSLSRYTTQAEVDRVLEVMPAIAQRLRALSPFNNDSADWLQGREAALAANG
ncbi:MAG: cysteine desulfurase NifS [Cyanobacteria bacterium SID2]|nr:cysteine desulfurase NifS [Cyanobacteria bacterium SID2]MBP0004128.1 cysteine desulfurase NifS [Cyanobacteria bacterium SBC]